MVRKVLAATAALLVGFHAWVFVTQLGDGRLADPAVLGRWALAGGLVAALWYLRRQNASVVWGRKAISVWLLAALLHAPALTDRLATIDNLAASDVASAILQVSSAAGFLALVVLAARALARAKQPASWHAHVPPPAPPFIWRLSSSPLAPRPPPAR